MQLKTYTADSPGAALRLARLELGGDAALVDSKEASEGGRTRYEATFALPEAPEEEDVLANRLPDGRHWRSFIPPRLEPGAAAGRGSGGAAAAPARALEQPAPLQNDPGLKAILIQLRALQSAVDALRRAEGAVEPASGVRQTLNLLQETGLDLDSWPALREGLEREAARGRNAFELEAWLRAQVSVGWKTAPGLGDVAAFVGPSGSGKTSSLLKLAVQLGLRCKRPAHLLLADPVRWGSAEALGAQAESAGAVLTVARGPEDLPRKLKRIRDEGPAEALILIDTPSYAPSETARAADLAAALEEVGGVETHLTLSAAVGEGELRRAVESAKVFLPSRLLFTHLDVALRPGALWNESSRSGLPISFLGTGPKTPDDLRAANPGRLTNLLFSR